MRKKIVAMILAAAMVLSVASCGVGVKTTEQVDSSKTTLYVGNFAGGVGSEWLESAMDKFEEKYADVSFEEGKKGVQLILGENNKTTMAGQELEKMISTSKTEVFFTQGVYYNDWVNKGLLHDITGITEEKLTEYGEDKSIAEKMYPELAESLKVDDKYYALPFWEAFYGLVYNATLFDENSWYIAEDGSFTNASGKLGAGPDGKAGTYDDGMPATYEQFFAMLDEMVKDNVTPLQWGSNEYIIWYLGSLFADYEGYDDLMINYTFDGETDLVKLDTIDSKNMTYETEKVAISQKNGYELARQEGYLKVLNFAEKFFRGKGYYDANVSMSTAYKISDAQLAFVRNARTTDKKPVAMIVEGCWWENEASTAFQETYGTNATKFDNEMEMKWMPLPKASEAQVGSENIQVAPLSSYCFINANIAEQKAKVAELFLQFCHTDAMMEEFTAITGMFKPYNYEVSAEKMTPSAKSILEVRENSRIVYPMDDNPVYLYASQQFRLAELFTTKYDAGQDSSLDIGAILIRKEGANYLYDSVDLFKGLLTYRQKSLWPTLESAIQK